MTSASTPLGVIFHRAILMSGSSLAPWALLTDPLNSTVRLAESLHCPVQSPQLLFCLRRQPLAALFAALPEPYQFVPAFGPSMDGIVIGDEQLTNQPAYNHRLNSYQLLLGTWSGAAAGLHVPAAGGTSQQQRDQVLATYVRNTYSFHLNELVSTVKYQYTDWTTVHATQDGHQLADPRLTQQLTEILNDARYTSAQVHTASLMARSRHVYFYVLQTDKHSAVQAAGGEVPLVFGYPLLGDKWYGRSWTQEEKRLSMQMMNYWTNFARTGDPNQPRRAGDLEGAALEPSVDWLRYNTHRRHLLLESGGTCRMSSHYRADKVALWLNLIPEIHRRGRTASTSEQHQHHQLDQQRYHGAVRTVPATWHVLPAPSDGGGSGTVFSAETNVSAILDSGLGVGVISDGPGSASPGAHSSSDSSRLPAAFGAAYSSALGVTVAIGCSLLVLNMLTLAAVYHQRQKQRRQQQRQIPSKLQGELAAGSCSSDSSCRCVLRQPTDRLSSNTLDCELSSALAQPTDDLDANTAGKCLRVSTDLYSSSGEAASSATIDRSRDRAQPPPQFADQHPHPHLHHHMHQQQQRKYSGGHFDTSIVIDESAVCPFSTGSLPRQRLTSCDLVNSNAVKKSAISSREKLSELRV